MPSNVEIKARARAFERQRQTAERLCGTAATLLIQEDTFFHVPAGRMKLREQNGRPGELIYYDRPDQKGPKQSNYSIAFTAEPAALKTVLAQALGIRGVLKKTRWLYMLGQTRIHCDEVAGLGHFLELEVVLRQDQSVEDGQRIAATICAQMDIQEADLMDGAYIDLVLKSE